ncbi:hypothetical protein RBA41_21985 [Massilia sp. CCM 9210]|uniref:hypothetical protein n=1 Tax=Massilia scottii TaxID=3057166 RepID=UPI0027964958|nr:hypothetical protein [Massilia sp. CCM 9210]MDQ1815971.1 hypothetical protein [Massilia sp. CCM 9210]
MSFTPFSGHALGWRRPAHVHLKYEAQLNAVIAGFCERRSRAVDRGDAPDRQPGQKNAQHSNRAAAAVTQQVRIDTHIPDCFIGVSARRIAGSSSEVDEYADHDGGM